MFHRAFGDDPAAAGDEAGRTERWTRLIGGDPGGAWAAERDGALVGVSIAILREGLWGSSLLVVEPAAQGVGTGGALLERALAYGAGAATGLVASSDDHRALRLYVRAGFRLLPCLEGAGRVRRAGLPPAAPDVRPGELDDLDLARRLDREQRGAARGDELEHAVSSGHVSMWVVPDRGYALVRPGALVCLAARDAGGSRAAGHRPRRGAARRVLHGPAPDRDQPWAMELAVAAGLELRRGGALGVRGRPGPLAPYVPSGAWV